jgi:hypothetical protein
MKTLSMLLTANLCAQLSVTAQHMMALDSSSSQSDQYAQTSIPQQGYWRVMTQPDTRSTVVRFYNHDSQVVYEEQLSGRYIKLNDRNVARLDRTLARLTDGSLVAASVKTEPLRAEKVIYKEHTAMPLATATTGLFVESFPLISQDKLLVRFQNPEGYRMHIAIRDGRDRNIYNDSVVQKEYQRKFDLSQLAAGMYTLVVSNYKGRVQHTQTFRIGGEE